jgi:RES domain-containing protein
MTSETFPRTRVEARLRSRVIETAYRIIWRRYRSDLLSPTLRKSRFSDGTFAVVYAASSFETALLETMIRDRFVRANRRMIDSEDHIHERLVATLRTRLGIELNLLDLRDSGIVELGPPYGRTSSAQSASRSSIGPQYLPRTY